MTPLHVALLYSIIGIVFSMISLHLPTLLLPEKVLLKIQEQNDKRQEAAIILALSLLVWPVLFTRFLFSLLKLSLLKKHN